jgi:hypothetical protein
LHSHVAAGGCLNTKSDDVIFRIHWILSEPAACSLMGQATQSYSPYQAQNFYTFWILITQLTIFLCSRISIMVFGMFFGQCENLCTNLESARRRRHRRCTNIESGLLGWYWLATLNFLLCRTNRHPHRLHPGLRLMPSASRHNL